MRLNRRKNCSGLLVIVYWLLVSGVSSVHGQTALLDLNAQIQAKKQAQRDLQRQMEQYREKIRTTQKKAASLANQINILESNITKTELEIKTKALEAQQLALETELVEQSIQSEEERSLKTLQDIAAVLRQVKKFDNRQYVDILLTEDSFSKVFDQLYYTERLGNTLREKLDTIKSIRTLLEGNKELLEEKKQETETRKEGLTILQSSFEQGKRVKEALFGKTKSTEAEFQQLLAELRKAAAGVDSEIVTIEKTIREKLDIADKLAGDTGVLSWPVPPIGGISAGFHDPEYPFRYLFEHTGMDIRTPQGTPVRAAASGYVAKAFNGGLGVTPSYVVLVHGNQLSTVYMHVTAITVAPDTFVARGDIIARSGGAARTAGAGRWSTGPHLHFETRIKGVPVDPVGYLP